MKKIYLLIACVLILLLSIKNIYAEVYSSVSGKVIADDRNKGIEGVAVTAFDIDGYRCFTKTDGRGFYHLENLQSGEYKIHFSKNHSKYMVQIEPVIVTLEKGKHLTNLNYMLKLGGMISGTIYNEDGVTPLGNIPVFTQSYDLNLLDYYSHTNTITASDGTFLLEGLPDSDNYLVYLGIDGIGTIHKEVQVKGRNTTTGVNLIVKRNDITGISGAVSIDGEPVLNAHVSISNVEDKLPSSNTSTDERGKYSIIGLHQGAYDVFVSIPNKGFLQEENVLVVPDKSTIINFEFKSN